MLITKKSGLTSIEHTREIDCTPDQLERYNSGQDLVQVIFPHLSPDDREFLMTGIIPEEWDDALGDDE